MRSFIVTGLLIVFSYVHAQVSPAVIESEVSRTEKTLAADDMQGRQVFTPGIEKAAAFITKEFNEAGLKPLPGSKDYNQTLQWLIPSSWRRRSHWMLFLLIKKSCCLLGRIIPDYYTGRSLSEDIRKERP